MKRVILILLTLMCLGLLVTVESAEFKRLSLAGTSYDWVIEIDTAGVGAEEVYINDTTISDTFDLFEIFGDTTYYKYFNSVVYIYKFDSGPVLAEDTLLDSIFIETMTTFGGESPSYAIYTDTCTDIPCIVRHHTITDTMMYRYVWYRIHAEDSLASGEMDTNTYTGWMDVIGGGTRND